MHLGDALSPPLPYFATYIFPFRLKRELEEEKAISKLNANRAAAAVKTVVVKSASKSRKKTSKSKSNAFNASAMKKVRLLTVYQRTIL